ncbi:MAG TPA: class I SAM-dependent methyltransferase [Candidatus Ozemobacteraceae bacterium]|nr:class I SAM-dependent methyltransferase [Candidatus Ozemobacteraceae bacterium]
MDRQTRDYYSRSAKKLAAEYRAASVEHLHQTLKELANTATTALDLGCGSGREMAALATLGTRVWGADSSMEMLHEIQVSYPEFRDQLIQCCLPTRLPFRTASFELLLSVSVLMHLDIYDIPFVFSECRRVLKNQGKFLFSVPLTRTDIRNGRDPHGRQFTMSASETWEKMVLDSGFSVEQRLREADGLGRSGTSWITFVCACRE